MGRESNEDRVSILLNIGQPSNKTTAKVWPNCHLFAVYDGHGGSRCADFLRDNLHHFVFHEKSFPAKPDEAMVEGFRKTENEFFNTVRNEQETSGSCALVVLFTNDECYVGNLGDSRLIMSSYHGTQIAQVTRDHKPNDPDEYERIIKSGGAVFQ